MIKQFIRYALIGAVNTAMDFGIYTWLTRGFDFWRAHYLVANGITFIIVVTWSFFLNKHWSFQNKEGRHGMQYMQFVAVTLVGISITEAGLYVGVEIFSFYDLVAKLIFGGPLVILWNFFAYRWIFSQRVSRESSEEKGFL